MPDFEYDLLGDTEALICVMDDMMKESMKTDSQQNANRTVTIHGRAYNIQRSSFGGNGA